MSVRFQIAALLSVVVNAVVFGVGAITVLTVPPFAEQAKFLLPLCVVMSLIITPLIAWLIAPRLRNRYWRRREAMQKLAYKGTG
jgi:uncharacterized Tic20 family protein